MIRVLLFFLLAFTTLAGQASVPSSPVILLIGDSLSVGYGFHPEQSWAHLMSQQLARENLPYRLVNSSVTGDTTANGLNRLPRLLDQYNPDIVIIELGGNDGLRGLPLKLIEQNLSSMIELAQQRNARVLLLGMHIPPNYGQRYTAAFHHLYLSLSKRYQTGLMPFLLEGVGDRSELMQPDGIHPSQRAQPVIMNNVWPYLKPMLKQ